MSATTFSFTIDHADSNQAFVCTKDSCPQPPEVTITLKVHDDEGTIEESVLHSCEEHLETVIEIFRRMITFAVVPPLEEPPIQ